MKTYSLFRIAALAVSLFSIVDLAAAEKRVKAEAAKGSAETSTPADKIDINTADVATLETLPGVGPSVARAIVAGRPYKNVSDLERVEGIGAERLKDLRGKVTASKVAVASRPAGEERASERKSERAREKSARDRDLDQGTIARERAPASTRTTPAPRPVSTPAPRETPDETVRAERPRDTQGRFISRADAAGRVDLNSASREELEALPEIGPVKAQAIIEARPFSSPADVMRVKGIKEGTYEAIKDRITVGGAN